MKISIGRRLDDCGGAGPGFDHLRIGLSLSIFLWHSFSISYGQDYANSLQRFPVPPLLGTLLPMFFGLSGFLVMGSAIRTANLRTFLAFRVLRILPALFTEITISALVVGPMLTTVPLVKYFSDPMFFEYFGSLIGRVRFSLPGLFTGNPTPGLVNFALWTVGPEILCYLVLTILMLSGAYRKKPAMLAITFAYTIVAISAGLFVPNHRIGEVLPSKFLIFSFLTGNLLFLYRDRIPYSRAAALVAFPFAIFLIFLSQETGIEGFSYLAVPGLIYTVAVVGLTSLPKIPLLSDGDYSYGVYIYGFPIQQSVAYFLPQFRFWWVNLAIALPLVLIVAVCSWNFVEKPFLGLRKRVAISIRPSGESDGTLSPIRKIAWYLGLSIYCLFVLDANSVLPVRPIAKSVLSQVGLYHYPDQ